MSRDNKSAKRSAVIYTRVSTKEQLDNFSLETQERDCRALCDRQGLSVERVFEERGESAKTDDRTELKALLAYCSAHKATLHAVVVWKVDRFSRNTADYLALRALLKRQGITLLSVNESLGDSASDWLLELMIAGFAEYD